MEELSNILARNEGEHRDGEAPNYVAAAYEDFASVEFVAESAHDKGGHNCLPVFATVIVTVAFGVGVEAAGLGVDNPKNAATIANGKLGIFHGMKSYFLQDEYGQIAPVYSISAGLDYPGIGPEHAYLHDIGRAEYVPATDKEAVEAFNYLSKTEGIIPAIESAHAVAYAMKLAPTLPKDKIMVINISGRGDKDVAAIARYMGVDLHE